MAFDLEGTLSKIDKKFDDPKLILIACEYIENIREPEKSELKNRHPKIYEAMFSKYTLDHIQAFKVFALRTADSIGTGRQNLIELNKTDNRHLEKVIKAYQSLVCEARSNSRLYEQSQLDPRAIDQITLFYYDYINWKHIDRSKNEELLQTLESLKRRGMILALHTNAASSIMDPALTHLGIPKKYFSYSGESLTFCGDNPDYKRPNTIVLEKIGKITGIPPKKSMFIGDNEYKDIKTAKAAGYSSCLVTWLKKVIKTSADCQISEVYKFRDCSIDDLLEHKSDLWIPEPAAYKH